MMPYGLYREVKRLLETNDLGKVAIGNKLGVTRQAVHRIATEKTVRQPPKRFRKSTAPDGKKPKWAPSYPKPIQAGPVVRCPGCGQKTQMPCRVCETRAGMGDST